MTTPRFTYSPFIRTAFIHKTENDINTFPFIRFQEGEFDEEMSFNGGMTRLELVMDRKIIEVGSTSVKCEVENIVDDPRFDALAENLTLVSDFDISKYLAWLYRDRAELIDIEELNWWQSMVAGIFGYRTPTYLDGEGTLKSTRKLGTLILSDANKLYSSSRIGKGDFVVVNNRLGNLIMDLAGFIIKPYDLSQSQLDAYPIQKIGEYLGLSIFVDYTLDWDDTQLVVGRSTKEARGGGVLFVHKDREFQTTENSLTLTSNYTITTFGSMDGLAIMRNIEFKKPFWKKILGL